VFNKVLNYSLLRPYYGIACEADLFFTTYKEKYHFSSFCNRFTHSNPFFPLSVIFIFSALSLSRKREASNRRETIKRRVSTTSGEICVYVYISSTFPHTRTLVCRIDTALRHIICIMYGPPLRTS